jgi:purine-binding chemotaxis protein CheW
LTVHVRMRVGAEQYAFPVENVLEVAELGQLAPVPGTGSIVLGVRNLRGRVLPVFDLGLLLGDSGRRAPSMLVVAEEHGLQAGLAIDEVIDVAELSETSPEPTAQLLAGSTHEDGQRVGVIDAGRVFAVLEGQTAP